MASETWIWDPPATAAKASVARVGRPAVTPATAPPAPAACAGSGGCDPPDPVGEAFGDAGGWPGVVTVDPRLAGADRRFHVGLERLGGERHLVGHFGPFAGGVGLFLGSRHGGVALGDLRDVVLPDGWRRQGVGELEAFELGVIAGCGVGRGYGRQVFGLPVEDPVFTLRRRIADITGVSKGSML